MRIPVATNLRGIAEDEDFAKEMSINEAKLIHQAADLITDMAEAIDEFLSLEVDEPDGEQVMQLGHVLNKALGRV